MLERLLKTLFYRTCSKFRTKSKTSFVTVVPSSVSWIKLISFFVDISFIPFWIFLKLAWSAPENVYFWPGRVFLGFLFYEILY